MKWMWNTIILFAVMCAPQYSSGVELDVADVDCQKMAESLGLVPKDVSTSDRTKTIIDTLNGTDSKTAR